MNIILLIFEFSAYFPHRESSHKDPSPLRFNLYSPILFSHMMMILGNSLIHLKCDPVSGGSLEWGRTKYYQRSHLLCRQLCLFSSESAVWWWTTQHAPFPAIQHPLSSFSLSHELDFSRTKDYICYGMEWKLMSPFMIWWYFPIHCMRPEAWLKGQVNVMRVTCNFDSIQDRLIITETNFHHKQKNWRWSINKTRNKRDK